MHPTAARELPADQAAAAWGVRAQEVSFLGWESGRLRHPAYSGLSRIL
jgi:hypothetical protein